MDASSLISGTISSGLSHLPLSFSLNSFKWTLFFKRIGCIKAISWILEALAFSWSFLRSWSFLSTSCAFSTAAFSRALRLASFLLSRSSAAWRCASIRASSRARRSLSLASFFLIFSSILAISFSIRFSSLPILARAICLVCLTILATIISLLAYSSCLYKSALSNSSSDTPKALGYNWSTISSICLYTTLTDSL